MHFKPLPSKFFFNYGIYFNIILFLMVVVLSSVGMYMFRDILLQNARSTGMTLANNYAAEERNKLSVYETLLDFGAAAIDIRLQEDTEQDMLQSMTVFFDRLQKVLGKDMVNPYIILNGKVWDQYGQEVQLKGINPAERDWYRQSMAAPGKTIFTGVYEDAATGEPVITAARRCRISSAVIVFDIFSHNFHSQLLPEYHNPCDSFFLCDAEGNLLYRHTTLDAPDNAIQDYVDGILTKIRNGGFDTYDSYVIDLKGQKRAVYYSRIPNGWYAILTIPYATILQEADLLFYLFALFTGLFFIFLVIYSMRFVRENAFLERTNETVRVLGNSYYALYRVNFGRNTYETIKRSPYIQKDLPSSGCYDELLHTIASLIEPDGRTEYMRTFSCEHIRSLVAQRISDFGGEFRRLFGKEYRWVSVHVLFDKTLVPEEVVLCFREVEREKQRQLQERKLLKDSLESAQRSEKAKQSFFSSMSHDMRTPINAIIGMSELVTNCLDDKERIRNYLEKIIFSARQLKSLIDDILNMSRMEQGKLALNNHEIELRQCLSECLGTYHVQAEMQGKTLHVDMSIANAWVMGDPMRIVQLMNNLLSNAFKFTSRGDTISVSVSQLEKGDVSKYKIVVADTGIGISSEFLPHLFEPYTRETRYSTKHVAGTGLGMPIAKNLVEQMNGEIRVESMLGKGSTFTIVLPFATAKPEKNAKDAPGTPPDLHMLHGMRILLVEDNEVNMELAAEMLTINGMEVSQAWNGREAVEQFAASTPFFFHAVLMDMQMPEMDGCEAARLIRAMDRPDARSVPIIAVTANAFAEDIASTTAAGMDMHIAKPIDFRYLFQMLIDVMEKDKRHPRV